MCSIKLQEIDMKERQWEHKITIRTIYKKKPSLDNKVDFKQTETVLVGVNSCYSKEWELNFAVCKENTVSPFILLFALWLIKIKIIYLTRMQGTMEVVTHKKMFITVGSPNLYHVQRYSMCQSQNWPQSHRTTPTSF